MTTPTTILNSLLSQLSSNETLSGYVKAFFLGDRDDVPNYPYICLEPEENIELEDDINNKILLQMNVAIIAVISHTLKDQHIIGTNELGILDLENEIKKVIDSDRTFGGYAIRSKILSTRFAVNFPKRELVMTIQIMFRQTRTTRT